MRDNPEMHILQSASLTCEVRVVGGVGEVVGQRKCHVLTLVQFLWRDDAILFSIQIPCKTLNGDLP